MNPSGKPQLCIGKRLGQIIPRRGEGRWANVWALKVLALLREEAAGNWAATCNFFSALKKDPAWGISEGAHLVQENSAGGPSGARATPSTHGGGRLRSPLTPGPSGGPRARKALSGRVQPASGASEVWTPRGVCARERASSNRAGQVEATKIKSDLPAWRSTPPPPWFDPRPGRSEPRRVQPRLQAVARYCRRNGAAPTPLPPVATTWEPSSQGGVGVTGEHGEGSVAVCKVSAGPSRRPGEEDRKVGMRRSPSQ